METLEQQLVLAKENFYAHFMQTPLAVAYAPGRINIIGEHTDYNQGLSMPGAINRWITVAIAPRTDKEIHIVSKEFDGEIKFNWSDTYQPKVSWEEYVYGCLLLFHKVAPFNEGFNAVISGNVPIGSGVSSSAALEVAFMNALNHLAKKPLDKLTLIRLCQQVEHQYLNVKSGLLDQYASQFSVSGQVMVLDFLTISHTYITADTKGYVWVLCDSKVQRTLAGSKYSERVQETQQGLLHLQQLYPEIKNFRDIEEKHLTALDDFTQKKRIRHYLSENKRVQDAVKALAAKKIDKFGTLITSSHLSLRDDYEVSCPALDFLVEQAIATNVCIGSRMMGGGFGGCTINLVKEDEVESFSKKVKEAYFKRFQVETEINVYQSVDGAGVFSVMKNGQYTS
ncbi:MAG TPA: galactokinase [Cytophagaceae bacterium]|nr:galactokinase [Cytophagaceae bacterium]